MYISICAWPTLLVRVHRPPDIGFLHLEFGQFHAVASLDVPISVAMERLLEGLVYGHPADPDDAADFAKRDAFVGVLRNRLGELEDQFFATAFLGSGLLFLASLFGVAAVMRALVDTMARAKDY